MTTYGIGLIGCGSIAQSHHLPAYHKLGQRVKLVAVYDKDPEASAVAVERYGFPRAAPSLDDLLADEEVQVVSVCTPPDVRSEVVLPAIEAGKHLLVEKPMALHADEAERLVSAAEARGVKLAANQNYRWLPSTVAARQAIRDCALGDVVWLDQRCYLWNDRPGWRRTVERLQISIMAIHWIDRFRFLLGREPQAVHCRTARPATHPAVGETACGILLDFGDGARGLIASSWSSREGEAPTLRLDGTGGSLIVRGEERATLRKAGAEPETRSLPGDFTSSFAASLASLLKAVETGTEPSASGRDNLKTLAIVEAAYASAASGETVAMPPDSPAAG